MSKDIDTQDNPSMDSEELKGHKPVRLLPTLARESELHLRKVEDDERYQTRKAKVAAIKLAAAGIDTSSPEFAAVVQRTAATDESDASDLHEKVDEVLDQANELIGEASPKTNKELKTQGHKKSINKGRSPVTKRQSADSIHSVRPWETTEFAVGTFGVELAAGKERARTALMGEEGNSCDEDCRRIVLLSGTPPSAPSGNKNEKVRVVDHLSSLRVQLDELSETLDARMAKLEGTVRHVQSEVQSVRIALERTRPVTKKPTLRISRAEETKEAAEAHMVAQPPLLKKRGQSLLQDHLELAGAAEEKYKVPSGPVIPMEEYEAGAQQECPSSFGIPAFQEEVYFPRSDEVKPIGGTLAEDLGVGVPSSKPKRKERGKQNRMPPKTASPNSSKKKGGLRRKTAPKDSEREKKLPRSVQKAMKSMSSDVLDVVTKSSNKSKPSRDRLRDHPESWLTETSPVREFSDGGRGSDTDYDAESHVAVDNDIRTRRGCKGNVARVET